jgi:hypothetical protein
MQLSSRILTLLYGDIFALTADDVIELRHYFTMENKDFIKLIDNIIAGYKKKEDIENFLCLLEYLHYEINEISPFISGNINKLFIMMIKNNYYKQIALYCDIFESSGNIKVLELLNNFVNSQKMGKFLSNMEIYKIKKLVLELSTKYKKDDIVYQIAVELEKSDSEWLDSIDK